MVMDTSKTMTEWREREMERQMAISTNRSRRMRGLPLVPVLEKLPHPKRVQVEDADGGYVGTYPVGVSVENAKLDAEENGYKAPFKVKMVDA